MNVDITQSYFIYKRNNIISYCVLLNKIIEIEHKKIWKNKTIMLTSLDKIINYYFINYYLKDENVLVESQKQEIIMDLIDKYPIVMKCNALRAKYSMIEILNLIIEYLQQLNDEKVLEKNLEELLLISIIVWTSINIDYYTCSLYKEKYDSKKFLDDIIKICSNISFIIVNEKEIRNISKIVKLALKNYDKDIKFFASLESDYSFNQYMCFSESDNYYLVLNNIVINKLNKYKDSIVTRAYNKLDINNRTYNLCMLNTNITILKEILLPKKVDTFFIPYHKKYWSSKKNINDFNQMFNSKYLKLKMNILISKDDYKADKEIVENLKKYGINVYSCSEKLDRKLPTLNSKQIIDK